MTFQEIKDQIMFQTNNDADDIEDFLPHVDDYVNDGYDRLVRAWMGQHVPDGGTPRLKEPTDVPRLPEWTHRAICDWATWLVYRNGNPQKQQRGLMFLRNFEECLGKCKDLAGRATVNEEMGEITFAKNLPQFYNYRP